MLATLGSQCPWSSTSLLLIWYMVTSSGEDTAAMGLPHRSVPIYGQSYKPWLILTRAATGELRTGHNHTVIAQTPQLPI